MPLSTLANDLGNPDAAAPASGLTAGGGVWGARPGVLAVGADACGSLLNTGDDDWRSVGGEPWSTSGCRSGRSGVDVLHGQGQMTSKMQTLISRL